MANQGLHEPREILPPEVLDRHRAIESLREEMEAVDWYDQRAANTHDPELRKILEHNRDEEKEHAAMVLEWLRRNDPKFDGYLREFLFKDGPIMDDHGHDHDHDEPAGADAAAAHSLGLGGLNGLRKETA